MPEQNLNNDPGKVIDIDENKLLAALSYVGVLVLVPLLVRRNDEFVRWHAKQGLVILAGLILALLAASWYPPAGNVLFLVLIILDVIALVQALLGRKWRIPVVGKIAESFKV